MRDIGISGGPTGNRDAHGGMAVPGGGSAPAGAFGLDCADNYGADGLRRRQDCLRYLGGMLEGGGGVAETPQPVDIGFAAEPGQLAFGVLASSLLDGGARLLEGEFAAEMGAKFAVADEVKGLGVFGQAGGEEAADFIEPAGGEHGFGARLDALIESLARRFKADFEDAPTCERRAAGLVDFGERFSG